MGADHAGAAVPDGRGSGGDAPGDRDSSLAGRSLTAASSKPEGVRRAGRGGWSCGRRVVGCKRGVCARVGCVTSDRCAHWCAAEGVPCQWCWNGRADTELVRRLARIVEEGDGVGEALLILGRINDRRAAPALRGLLGGLGVERDDVPDTDAQVRAAVVGSLGWSGVQDDVPAIAELLDDADLDVRSRARAALAELGGRRAADALFATVQGLDDDERGEVQGALAWLGDDRDLVATRRIAFEHFTDVPDDGWVPESGAWAAVAALIRIGDDHDRQILCDVAYEDVDRQLEQEPESEAIDEGEGEVPSYKITLPGRASRPVHLSVVYHLIWNLRRAGFGKDSDRLIERLRAHDRADEIGSFTGRQRGVVCEPFEPRTVPRLAFGGLRLGPVASTRGPAAKFGGQPDWLSEPEWPLDPDGDPMVFVAQFPLLGSERCAYMFFRSGPNRGVWLSEIPLLNQCWYRFDADDWDGTWAPESTAHALIVQPRSRTSLSSRRSQPSRLETRDVAMGPALFELDDEPHRYRPVGKRRMYERYIVLEDGADPTNWSWPQPPSGSEQIDSYGDWNKIGGTPRWLESDDNPGSAWKLAFQFTTIATGHTGGGPARCYGFVTDDGRGSLRWQRDEDQTPLSR